MYHPLYRYEVFKYGQRERLWEERRLARKTRLPDLDYHEKYFVTKGDRRAPWVKRRKRWTPG